MSCSLAYGAWLGDGVLAVPVDGALRLMYAASALSLLRYLVLLPACGFRIGRRVALSCFAFYAAYNLVYVLFLLGYLQ